MSIDDGAMKRRGHHTLLALVRTKCQAGGERWLWIGEGEVGIISSSSGQN